MPISQKIKNQLAFCKKSFNLIIETIQIPRKLSDTKLAKAYIYNTITKVKKIV